MNKQAADTVAHYLTVALSALVLLYLIVFTIAVPSKQLVGATIFEAAFFFALLAYRYWQSRRPRSIELSEALATIQGFSGRLVKVKQLFAMTSIIAASLSLSYVAVDLTALMAANAGFYQVARPLYTVTAPPAWAGLQPAFSLEVLAGACIESGNFEKAEKLEFENLSVRKGLVGENHELVASSYCDLGDLYRRQHFFQTAEIYYRKAINLATQINYYKGYGKPMTSLACLLRDEKRYAEAEIAFDKALTIRKKLFGSKSDKYSETLLEYARLLQAEGKAAEAQKALDYSESVRAELALKRRDDSVTPVVVSCAAVAIFTQKDRVIVFVARHLK